MSDNSKFCRSALARYTPQDFVQLVKQHGIAFEEKHKGQLFCRDSADDLIQMLIRECNGAITGGGVTHCYPCTVQMVRHGGAGIYELDTTRGPVGSRSLVIATGGLSIPQIGATDFGYRVAQQFGIHLVAPRPGLVPLTFDAAMWQVYAPLSGISLPARLRALSATQSVYFDEDLLFTHRGLSGPGILQISSYWQISKTIEINLAPDVVLAKELLDAKKYSKKLITNELARWFASRLAATWTNQSPAWQGALMETSDKALIELAHKFNHWSLTPSGSEGYRKAEVTVGGVDTKDVSQQTMESKQKGLYFIGEVLDVTGWLGGYNFQWAWSSAYACAQALPR